MHKRLRHHLGLYTDIRDKYKLNIGEKILKSQAYAYARHEADKHFTLVGSSLLKFLTGFVLQVVSVILSAGVNARESGDNSFGTQMASGLVSSVLDFVANVTQSALQENAQASLEFYAKSSASLQQARDLIHGLDQSAHNRVSSLIYQPYSIFPKGAIWEAQKPGSLGFVAGLEGYDPTKGIQGTYQESLKAEQLNNRAHRHLGGNTHYDPLNLPFPKARFEENFRRVMESIRAGLEKRQKEIKEGFKELCANYFGAFDTSIPQRLFNEHMRAEIHPRINQLNIRSFLEKMKYYPNGERLPLFDSMAYPSPLELPQNEHARQGNITIIQRENIRGCIWVDDERAWNKRAYANGKNFKRTYIFNTGGRVVEALQDFDYSFDKQVGEDEWKHYEGHKEGMPYDFAKGKLVILERQRKRALPKKSAQVLEYEKIKGVEPPPLSLEEEIKLKEAYDAYIKAFWGCFEIELLGVTDNNRPLRYAREKGWNSGNVFFYTPQKNLSELEKKKQNMFKEFLYWYFLKIEEEAMKNF
ncbi:hypothetical protein [Helicobacter felis]|uniref:hypothetical protein n=1 Tax=Helicobacter felis TaxID=214 RepID=UPI0018F7F908|nr:hypothetical protein [Helicobacter felis]